MSQTLDFNESFDTLHQILNVFMIGPNSYPSTSFILI